LAIVRSIMTRSPCQADRRPAASAHSRIFKQLSREIR
jgi:hypothetical protein